MSFNEKKSERKISSSKSVVVSEISTQNLIEDGLSPSEYKEDYSERRESSDTTSNKEKKYKCPKCDSSFLNKQTLDIHQKTSSKCAKSKSVGDDSSTSSDISKNCQYCEKTFASKQMRLYHETKCIDKIIRNIQDQHKDEMEFMKNEIQNQYKDDLESLKCEIESLRLELGKI